MAMMRLIFHGLMADQTCQGQFDVGEYHDPVWVLRHEFQRLHNTCSCAGLCAENIASESSLTLFSPFPSHVLGTKPSRLFPIHWSTMQP